MLFLIALPFVFGAVAKGWATDAKVNCNNPPDAQYIVNMTPSKNAGIDAQIVAQTGPDGCTNFVVNINGNPPAQVAPYLYHIHELPVPSDGNCTATLGHLDPYGRGETPPCDASQPQTCQVGDLSGKHGSIASLPGFSAHYTDKYVSLVSGNPSFLGNRSIVIHYNNLTRIACANFELVRQSSPSKSASPASCPPPSTVNSTSTSTPPYIIIPVVTPTGSAGASTSTSTVSGGAGALAVAMVAAVL
ncbi:Cu,Zn superoxide dismutase-like protein [Rhizodiscina lignyota]|uniref:superoxide dismutase n=1 Tax=Rhizodiscina lignyota TaxID=1504668 RepID=A0A9P4IL19_9PEZI|nr:Cu,Zn superoxide dismutase-like protein [Rhizodiscina lignyota]